jgi:hypothetical protein
MPITLIFSELKHAVLTKPREGFNHVIIYASGLAAAEEATTLGI